MWTCMFIDGIRCTACRRQAEVVQDINTQLSALQLPALPDESADSVDKLWKWSDIGTLPKIHAQRDGVSKWFPEPQVAPQSTCPGTPMPLDYTPVSTPAAIPAAGGQKKAARPDDTTALHKSPMDHKHHRSCSPQNTAHAQSTLHRAAAWCGPDSRSPSPHHFASSEPQGQPRTVTPSCTTLPGMQRPRDGKQGADIAAFYSNISFWRFELCSHVVS